MHNSHDNVNDERIIFKGRHTHMVSTLLLLVIYLAYISLGLPDGLVGVAWPDIRSQFMIPLTAAGYISVTSTICSTTSAFSSGHLLKKIGPGKMVFGGCLLFGIAMFGFSVAWVFPIMVLFSIPQGLGAGSVDAALNHFVSKNLTSRHMNWMHAFWGIGASIGPIIMTYAILWTGRWNNGFLLVAIVQLTLAFFFLLTLREWKKAEAEKLPQGASSEKTPQSADNLDNPLLEDARSKGSVFNRLWHGFLLVFKQHGLLISMLTFFFYVGAEGTIGFWSATYFRNYRGVPTESAGLWITLFYGFITGGRILFGFFVEKIGTRIAVRSGIGISLVGLILILFPLPTTILCPIGMAMIGLGFAPIFPCVMQDTPLRFGSLSPTAIGYQLGMANIGYALLPLLAAAVAERISLYLIPFASLFFLLCFAICFLAVDRMRTKQAN